VSVPIEIVRCPFCGGEARLTRSMEPVTILDRTVVVEDEYYQCRICLERVYRPGMMDAVLSRAKARMALDHLQA
jgi:hypothetical protein